MCYSSHFPRKIWKLHSTVRSSRLFYALVNYAKVFLLQLICGFKQSIKNGFIKPAGWDEFNNYFLGDRSNSVHRWSPQYYLFIRIWKVQPRLFYTRILPVENSINSRNVDAYVFYNNRTTDRGGSRLGPGRTFVPCRRP